MSGRRNILKRYASGCDTDQNPERMPRVLVPRVHARESGKRHILRWESPTTYRARDRSQSPGTDPSRGLKPARPRVRRDDPLRVQESRADSRLRRDRFPLRAGRCAQQRLDLRPLVPRTAALRRKRSTSVCRSVTAGVGGSYGGNRSLSPVKKQGHQALSTIDTRKGWDNGR